MSASVGTCEIVREANSIVMLGSEYLFRPKVSGHAGRKAHYARRRASGLAAPVPCRTIRPKGASRHLGLTRTLCNVPCLRGMLTVVVMKATAKIRLSFLFKIRTAFPVRIAKSQHSSAWPHLRGRVVCNKLWFGGRGISWSSAPFWRRRLLSP